MFTHTQISRHAIPKAAKVFTSLRGWAMLTATALLAKTGFRNRTHIAKTPAPALNTAFPRALSLTA